MKIDKNKDEILANSGKSVNLNNGGAGANGEGKNKKKKCC